MCRWIFIHLKLETFLNEAVPPPSLQNNKPLYSFEDNSDYVYDVMWSPTHPALFACVDGVGHLDLWNLNNDTEVILIDISQKSSCVLLPTLV